MLADTLINTTTKDTQGTPLIIALSDGSFVVSWVSLDQDGDDYGIYAQRFDASGMAQGQEFRVNTFTARDQASHSTTAHIDGGFVLSWSSYDQDDNSPGIYAQRYDMNGVAEGNEARINTYTAGYQDKPSITVLNNGDFLASWQSLNQDGDNFGIYAQRFDSSGVMQGSEFRVNTYTASSQDFPSITALDDGGFVVSWTSWNQDGDGYGIYAQRFDASGSAQGNEFRVNTHTTNDQYSPAITALNDGGFVVCWASLGQDGEGYGIYAQRYDANGLPQGSEFLVNTYTAKTQQTPAITALNDGGFVVNWASEGQDGSALGIYAQRFDVNGSSVGSEFQVNTNTDGNQATPSIIARKDGGIVITWESEDLANFSSDVYGKCYDFNGNEIEWIISEDRIFNWAESISSDLLPNHSESINISGYYARIYENGNAVGEQNDNLYFYDGNSIALVGSVNDFLPDAIAAGF